MSTSNSNKQIIAKVDVKRPSSSTKKKPKPVWVWTPECKYSVILNKLKRIDWKAITNEKFVDKCNLYWVDVATIQERFKTIQPWQTINHFPGMPNIARKGRMGINLNKMLKVFPKDYSYYPRTWILPGEMSEFRKEFDGQGNSLGNKVYIIKPDAGCQGKGIFLTRTLDNVPQNESVVAQLYITKPMLLDGFKFDLRLYCLVTSVKPLRMYLFHDGLVRMCTEEYVKPTAKNINQVCMHLTNYAVNKNNDDFVQPSADSSENNEGQDGASKRSLKWFMEWFKEKYGSEKTKLIWKRMGTVIVRTVLSILPTLSREYDQHFKSFNNVPYKSDKSKSSKYEKTSETINLKEKTKGSGNGNSAINKGCAEEEEEDKDDHEDDEDDEDGDRSQDDEQNHDDDKDEGAGENGSEGEGSGPPRPSTRGSRCFEVLGLDIMIDKNLKVLLSYTYILYTLNLMSLIDRQIWLIEVNHLPSFGTDSPLDLDIKERLMDQVFDSLPILSDDEESYAQYHKEESERRLTGEREKKMTRHQKEQAEREEREKRQLALKKQTQFLTKPKVVSPPPPVIPAPKSRIDEIKEELLRIYEEFSPEKMSKIDKLLSKYIDREEEFLQFVIEKYGVVVEPKDEVKDDTALVLQPPTESEREIEKVITEVKHTPMLVPKPPSLKDQRPARSSTGISKRSSRSLSPELGPTRRASTIWKTGGDDDDNWREELLKLYVPKEDNEWMVWESQFLSQFTRIFPLETNKDTDNGDEEEEGKDGDDEDNEFSSSSIQTDVVVGNLTQSLSVPAISQQIIAKRKAVTFEEIICEVFRQDRRQTMRMYCPLPNKQRPSSETQTGLPPLDTYKGPLHGSIAANLARPGVGWKAPPKKELTERGNIAQPTASQLEAARRLSQGLSVKEGMGKREKDLISSNQGLLLNFRSGQNVAMYEGYHDDLLSLGQASVIGGNEDVSITPRIRRLMEQNRLVRMKYENARHINHQPIAVKQQMYLFDDTAYSNPAPVGLHLDNGSSVIPTNMMGQSGGTQRASMYQPIATSTTSSSFRGSNIMMQGAGSYGAQSQGYGKQSLATSGIVGGYKLTSTVRHQLAIQEQHRQQQQQIQQQQIQQQQQHQLLNGNMPLALNDRRERVTQNEDYLKALFPSNGSGWL